MPPTFERRQSGSPVPDQQEDDTDLLAGDAIEAGEEQRDIRAFYERKAAGRQTDSDRLFERAMRG